MEEDYKINPAPDDLVEILGPEKVHRDLYENNRYWSGNRFGLDFSGWGHPFYRVCNFDGKGQLTITGNLGKVMKESATIAMEFIQSR